MSNGREKVTIEVYKADAELIERIALEWKQSAADVVQENMRKTRLSRLPPHSKVFLGGKHVKPIVI